MNRMWKSFVVALALGSAAALAQDAPGPPCHDHGKKGDPAHHAGVNERGDHVMGFDHTKTTHHFLLSATGGAIEVSANDPNDFESRDAIRAHLEHIAGMFAEGNFEAPMLIHDRVPPGVSTMKDRKSRIEWKFEETPDGGRVRITTKDAKALAAIHEFLRFQIEDHRTGDSTEISTDANR
jgi:hypothetical protein